MPAEGPEPPKLTTREKQWLYHRDKYAETGQDRHLRYMLAYVRLEHWLYDKPHQPAPLPVPVKKKRELSGLIVLGIVYGIAIFLWLLHLFALVFLR